MKHKPKDIKERLKKCRTRDDFFKLTRSWYGVGLTFTGTVGNYQIEQNQNWYAKFPKAKIRNEEFGQYEGLRKILDTTFGKIYCGGVAGSHYGQYKIAGYRSQIRLERLYSSTLSPLYQEIVHHYPKEARG